MLDRCYRVFDSDNLAAVMLYWLAVPILLLLYVLGVREKQKRTRIIWVKPDGSTFETSYVTPELLRYSYIDKSEY